MSRKFDRAFSMYRRLFDDVARNSPEVSSDYLVGFAHAAMLCNAIGSPEFRKARDLAQLIESERAKTTTV